MAAVSKKEHKKMLFAAARKNIKKSMAKWQGLLYWTRMMVEFNFRSLKQFFELATSMPRSLNSYFAH